MNYQDFLFLKLYFKKDLLINLSYKFSFISQFVTVLFQIFLFYYLSQIVSFDSNENIKITYFTFIIIGLCVIDVYSTIASSLPRELLNLKVNGVLEEIFLNQKNIFLIFLGVSLYPVFISLLKIIIFILIGSMMQGFSIIEVDFILEFIMMVFLMILCSIFIGFLACAYTLYFYKIRLITFIFLFLGIFFGQIYFPLSLVPEQLHFLAYFTPFYLVTENLRMLNELNFSLYEFYINTIQLLMITITYAIISLIVLKKSVSYAKKNGTFLHF